MALEERELRFVREAPLRAWRLFRVRASTDGLVLSSPMYHDPDPTPWPETQHTAVCYKGHAAPAPACRCGIYGSIPGTLDSLPGYLPDTAYDEAPFVYAEIACYGRVFVDVRGVRAEHAELLRIALPTTSWPNAVEQADVERQLDERYRVVVGGLEEVPDWVIENQRMQGPPPDEPALDLDALDLSSVGGDGIEPPTSCL
jgi:hypothetical protein